MDVAGDGRRSVRELLWNPSESRPRSPIRLVVGGVLCLLAIVVAQVAGYLLLGPAIFSVVVATIIAGVAVCSALWVAARFIDRRQFTDYGLRIDRDWWLDCAFGLALGAALQAGIFLVGLAAGWYRVRGTFVAEGSFLASLLPLVALFLVVGVYEELLARGWLLTNLAEGLRFAGRHVAVGAATLVSAGAFGVLHASNPGADAVSTAVITLAGVFLALGYLLTGELAIPIGIHVTWNLAQGPVFGFGVSGLDLETALIATDPVGPAWVTGGAFGPEGGLAGFLAVCVGSLAIVGWIRLRYGTEAIGIHEQVVTPTFRERDE